MRKGKEWERGTRIGERRGRKEYSFGRFWDCLEEKHRGKDWQHASEDFRGKKEERVTGKKWILIFLWEWSSDRRKKDNRVPSHCSQDCPGAFLTISYASSYSILDDSLMVLSIYFADWA